MNYADLAKQARLKVLEMVHRAGTSHIGSNFSVIDILTVLYEKSGKDDEIVISKGWAAAAAYYFLAQKGLIPKEDLDKFPQHPYIGLLETNVPGVKALTGAMGHGLPVAVGIADAMKNKGDEGKVYCVMSDGEQDCGTTWEAALNAPHLGLTNLTVIIDANGIQAMGNVKDVLNIEPLPMKFQAFGWNTYEILGHDYREIEMVLDMPSDRPKCIIARTIKGKGVKFMEGLLEWHYKKVDDESYILAKAELENT